MKSISIVIACLFAASTAAQEGAATVPGAYKIQFENEWVS